MRNYSSSYSFERLIIVVAVLTGEIARVWLLTIGHAQLLQEQRYLLWIDATIVGHIFLASFMQIHFAFLN